ncbi:Ig-like domain-containing protein [bacterium]|nr:Ig-like domain-containing protein [bacterium]
MEEEVFTIEPDKIGTKGVEFRLRVTDTGGNPIRGAEVTIFTSEGVSKLTNEEGCVSFFTDEGHIFVVEKQGYLPEYGNTIQGEYEVVLSRATFAGFIDILKTGFQYAKLLYQLRKVSRENRNKKED